MPGAGGASRAILMQAAADGIPFVHSSYHCLSNAKGDNIDSGVPLDLEIPNYDDQGQADYSKFFDYAYVSEYLSNAYTPA